MRPTMTNKEEIAELRAELDKVKRQLSGADVPSEEEVAAFRDRMHQMAEARALAFNPFTRDQLAAMRAACPDDTMRGLVRDSHAPQAPSIEEFTINVDQRLSDVRGSRGSLGKGTGWQEPTPIAPPPHVAQCDRLMDAQDRKDKADLIRAEAIRRAAELKTKGK